MLNNEIKDKFPFGHTPVPGLGEDFEKLIDDEVNLYLLTGGMNTDVIVMRKKIFRALERTFNMNLTDCSYDLQTLYENRKFTFLSYPNSLKAALPHGRRYIDRETRKPAAMLLNMDRENISADFFARLMAAHGVIAIPLETWTADSSRFISVLLVPYRRYVKTLTAEGEESLHIGQGPGRGREMTGGPFQDFSFRADTVFSKLTSKGAPHLKESSKGISGGFKA